MNPEQQAVGTRYCIWHLTAVHLKPNALYCVNSFWFWALVVSLHRSVAMFHSFFQTTRNLLVTWPPGWVFSFWSWRVSEKLGQYSPPQYEQQTALGSREKIRFALTGIAGLWDNCGLLHFQPFPPPHPPPPQLFLSNVQHSPRSVITFLCGYACVFGYEVMKKPHNKRFS